MLGFNFRAWLRRVSGKIFRNPFRHPRPAPRRTLPCKLLIELLEDRVVPATLTVNSLAGNITDTSHLTLREAVTLVDHSGDPSSLGQGSMPGGWSSQITGTFGTNDTIQFDASLSGGTITLSG